MSTMRMDPLTAETVRKKPRLGWMGRLMLSLLVGCVAYMLIIAVFAPWGFFLGGHIHVLPVWHGIGHLKASSGDYVLYFWMSPAPGGRTYNYPYFRGWGYLCTPRGERYSLRATGSLHEHTGIDTNGKEMHLEFHRRPWNWAWTGGWDRRPRLDLSGQWRDAELVMDDGGTLSQAFLPDGTLYQGSPHSQPKVREKLHVAFQETPWTAWFADCRAK